MQYFLFVVLVVVALELYWFHRPASLRPPPPVVVDKRSDKPEDTQEETTLKLKTAARQNTPGPMVGGYTVHIDSGHPSLAPQPKQPDREDAAILPPAFRDFVQTHGVTETDRGDMRDVTEVTRVVETIRQGEQAVQATSSVASHESQTTILPLTDEGVQANLIPKRRRHKKTQTRFAEMVPHHQTELEEHEAQTDWITVPMRDAAVQTVEPDSDKLSESESKSASQKSVLPKLSANLTFVRKQDDMPKVDWGATEESLYYSQSPSKTPSKSPKDNSQKSDSKKLEDEGMPEQHSPVIVAPTKKPLVEEEVKSDLEPQEKREPSLTPKKQTPSLSLSDSWEKIDKVD